MMCVERHGNLCLCVRLALVNGTVLNKRMSTSLHHSHGLNHLLMYVPGKRRLMSWLENSVCPLKQLLCLTELQLSTHPSLSVKKTHHQTRQENPPAVQQYWLHNDMDWEWEVKCVPMQAKSLLLGLEMIGAEKTEREWEVIPWLFIQRRWKILLIQSNIYTYC